ncbi:MAG: hypothetical protein AB1540_06735 [Bdellovibrionota bacterium]
MFRAYLRAFKLKSAFVVAVVNLGLIFAIYGFATVPKPQGFEPSHWFLLVGICGIYGGIFLGLFFVLWPLVSMALKIRQILRWREWILKELPTILALIPTVVESLRKAFQGDLSGAASQMSRAASGHPQGKGESPVTSSSQEGRDDDEKQAA